MIELVCRAKCYSCGACLSICAHNAISAEQEDGFFYPRVDGNLCVDCGLCKRVCPAEHVDSSNEILRLYSFQHNDENVVKHSSSGGAFTALSDKILEDGGVVIGAVLDEDHVVRHHIAMDSAGRDAMRGAKYVKSDMSAAYKAMRDMRSDNKKVLFCGTPCQAEAFRSYCCVLGLNLENVVICALVCHGASSPQIWGEYITRTLGAIPGDKVEINFRDKKSGWRHNRMTLCVDGQEHAMNAYSGLFYSKLCNSRACFSCPYASVERNCDITLGDFWSIQKFDEGHTEGYGVSKIIAHTEKGDALIQQCAQVGQLELFDFDPEVDSLQPALTHPYGKPVEYDQFWSDYHKLPFAKLEKKYTGKTLPDRLRRIVRKKLLEGKRPRNDSEA